ncbi:MAG: tetratricopeptide repeat protein [Planctomycetes bacterium]|nr:tetratricopeptide repeat protein [Planctomycetota bacterium]
MTRRRARLWLAAILLATIAVHAPSLGRGFAGDDRWIVQATFDDGRPNGMVRDLAQAVSRPYWSAVDPLDDPLWRPVTSGSYALVHALSGDPDGGLRETLPQHLVNVALHAIAAWLTYRLARHLHCSRGSSLCAAAVFGLHALHTEVVAQVVGRAELWAFVFGAGATLLAAGRGTARAAGAALACLLAFCSKESGLVWLGLVPWMLAVRPSDGSGRRWRAVGRGLLIAAPGAAIYIGLRTAVLAGLSRPPTAYGVNPLAHMEFAARAPVAASAWLHGVVQTLWPFDLRADYSAPVFDVSAGLLDLRPLLGVATLVLLVVVTIGGRRRPALSFGCAALLGSTLGVANLLFPIGTIYAERLWFTATLLPALAAGPAAARLRGRTPLAGVTLLAAWVGVSIGTTLRHAPRFDSDATLFAAEVARDDASARVHYSHAKILERRGDDAGARREVERSLELDPGMGVAWNDLAVHRIRAGDLDGATDAIRRGVAARDVSPDTRYRLFQNLAGLAALRGDAQIVRTALLRCTELDERRLLDRLGPFCDELVGRGFAADWLDATLGELCDAARDAAGFRAHRARNALRNGRFEAATALCRSALAGLPPGPLADDTRIWLAAALVEQGHRDEARAVLDELDATPRLDERSRRQAARLRALLGG